MSKALEYLKALNRRVDEMSVDELKALVDSLEVTDEDAAIYAEIEKRLLGKLE